MQLIIQLIENLTPYGSYAYLIMFGILIACGFGFPMPEDIILVTGGILSARGVVDFWVTVSVCMAGVLLGDGTVYSIGRILGPKIKGTYLYQKIVGKREHKIQSWFTKYGDKVIFFARFAPGLRTPLFLTSGLYRVSPWKFLALDGFAAIISVPVWIWVGKIFGANFELLEQKITQMQIGIFGIIGGLLLFLIAFVYIKKKLNRQLDE
ncbi:MAG: DedA family protein [Zetaproteobacteria bacterium]|nr:DedA family protein [Zetaproteobacteria bacterium]